MWDYSVTYHPAALTFLPFPQLQLVLDLATPKECKADLAQALQQGWVFAMAKTIFAGTVEKPVKTMAKTGKNWQNQRHHKLIIAFITHILQAAFEPYYNSGTDCEHK